MKILGVLIAAAAVASVSSEPYSSSYDYYGGSSSYSSGYGSSSKYYDDYYSKPSSSYGYGSSSKYYDDYYSKPSSSYGYGSSSKYYDDYYSKPSSSYGYGSSSKYDSYSKPSSSYGSSSSSKYYDDYYSKPSSSYGYGSSSKYDSYSKPSSSYGSSSSSKYYDDYYSKPSSSYGYGSSSKYYDDYYSEPSSSYGYGSSSKYDSYSKPSSSYGSGSSSKYDSYSKPSSSYGSGSSSKYDSYSKPSSSYGSGSSSKDYEDYYGEPEEGSVQSPATSESEGAGGNSTCNCGWVNKGRIVGGLEAKKNAYPFIVNIINNGGHWCGATILTERHILTAAHCTYDNKGRLLSPSRMEARVGGHHKGDGTVHKIERFINHERYSDAKMTNDISIFVLQTPIKIDQNVGPVCMPSKQVNLEGQKIRALGWGDLRDRGTPATYLQEVDLDVISDAQCEKSWKNERDHPTKGNNLCTYTDRKDTCQGDSGGPLVWLNPSTNRYTIAALVSFGGDCAGPLPAVNTNVAAYRDWINNKLSGSGLSACSKG